MKPGTKVECTCAPTCERCWPSGHGPCVRGVVVDPGDEEPPEANHVLVRMDHGGFTWLEDVGFGQRARRSYAPEAWCWTKTLRAAP